MRKLGKLFKKPVTKRRAERSKRKLLKQEKLQAQASRVG